MKDSLIIQKWKAEVLLIHPLSLRTDNHRVWFGSESPQLLESNSRTCWGYGVQVQDRQALVPTLKKLMRKSSKEPLRTAVNDGLDSELWVIIISIQISKGKPLFPPLTTLLIPNVCGLFPYQPILQLCGHQCVSYNSILTLTTQM